MRFFVFGDGSRESCGGGRLAAGVDGSGTELLHLSAGRGAHSRRARVCVCVCVDSLEELTLSSGGVAYDADIDVATEMSSFAGRLGNTAKEH